MVALAGATFRPGTRADAIDDVVPRQVVEPGSGREVAAVLEQAARERLTVVLRGGGTKLDWGRRPASLDLVVGLRRLNRLVVHAHADLTATVEAGATVAELNAALAGHRQWLPIDALEGATIGGVIATNDSGPLRHRYGTPRDLLIGVHLATTDGRLIKAGGTVVKNVAGYDLGKLVSGSFGSLAAIVSATFKLLPAPPASQTLVAGFRDPQAVAAAAAAITGSQLEPMALEVHASAGPTRAYQLLVRFATSPAATRAQTEAARGLVASSDTGVAAGPEETTLWREHAARVWAAPGAVIKLTWLPAALAQVLTAIADLQSAAGVTVQLAGRAGVGSGLLRIEGAPAAQAAAVERLRALPDLVRHVTVLRASPALKQKVDVWGSLGPAGTLAGVIKRALDPAGILNPGRGPV